MSGHSKWAQIKRKKAVTDLKRGKIFSKVIREIMIAARLGGGDPNGNPRLRTALNLAKLQNLGNDNIERAIKKGTGELAGETYEETICEGYGPGGTAVLVEALTDNKNRTVSEIRHIFSKNNANLGESGCVSWMFQKKGLITFDKNIAEEEKIISIALEAGAEDVSEQEMEFEVITEVQDFERVKEAFDKSALNYNLAEITVIPKNTVKIEGKEAEQLLRLMEQLEENEDVQHAYANFDIPEKVMESLRMKGGKNDY